MVAPHDHDIGPLGVARKPAAPVLEPPATRWPYLESAAFRLRGAVAAHFVRRCPTVVEIGGGRTPMDGYLDDAVEVIVVDPFLLDAERPLKHGGRARHVRGRFQDIVWDVRRPGGFGLVMLGLELLDMSEEDFANLYALIDAAAVTVLEFAATFATPREQYGLIRANTSVKETVRFTYDLDGNDFGGGAEDWPWPIHTEREFHILERER